MPDVKGDISSGSVLHSLDEAKSLQICRAVLPMVPGTT